MLNGVQVGQILLRRYQNHAPEAEDASDHFTYDGLCDVTFGNAAYDRTKCDVDYRGDVPLIGPKSAL